MSWVRFDDMFPIHRKVEGLSDAAFRLHAHAIFWCSRNETDGFIGTEELVHAAPRGMENPEAVVTELVTELTRYEDSRLWEETDGGWVIHDYLDYQPSKAQLNEERKKNAVRQARFRARTRENSNGVSNALGQRVTNTVTSESNAVTNSPSNAAPSRPVPIDKEDSLRSSSSRTAKAVTPLLAAAEFARFWAAYPRKVGKKAAEKAWTKAIQDGVTPAVLIDGAERYARERAGEDSRYTKHPSTWLGHGCWDDEPARRGFHSDNDARIADFLGASSRPGPPESPQRALPPGHAQ